MGEELPLWVTDPFYEGNFYAAGIARPSLRGFSQQRKDAIADGCNELARTISVREGCAIIDHFKPLVTLSGAKTVWLSGNEIGSEMSETITTTPINIRQPR